MRIFRNNTLNFFRRIYKRSYVDSLVDTFYKVFEVNIECNKRHLESMFADIIRFIDFETKLRKQVAS